MPSRFIRTLSAVLLFAAAPLFAQHWRVQYFYDEEKSVLHIEDLQFPSAARGVALGIVEEGSHEKPVALVTSDGGAHWQLTHLQEPPVSLFFLNEGLGWMVTTKGLWQTTEAGRSWHKLPRLPAPVYRVYFIDEKTGWAAGPKKKVFVTHDGAQHWENVAASAELPGNPAYSSFTWIAFATPQIGIITGFNLPPRRFERLPDWMDPEAAVKERDVPHLSYELATRDGGKTWNARSSSLFGDLTRVRFGPRGVGLGLIEFGNSFRYAAEVYKIDWLTGKNQTVYRDKQFAISDIWMTPDGTAYLAGAVVHGQIRNVIPGKVQVLESRDLATWKEMEIDYRAVANRVTLAVVDKDNMWLATDTGMILKAAP